ncbi:MAG: peptidase domain-containing ABC transporter [Paraclostridium sordellii]
MNKVKIVQQVQQSECGLCCVSMILKYYKSYETLEDLREFLEAGRDGLNIVQLKSILDFKNFDTKVVKCNVQSEKDLYSLKEISLPCIAFWNKEHFLVISKVTKKSIEVFDSASGRRNLSYSEFYQSFSGYILEATPNEKFIPKKEKAKKWRYTIKQLTEEKKLVFTASILSLFSYILTIVFPKMTQWFVDNYISNPINETSIDIKYIVIIVLLAIFLTIIITFARNLSIVLMKIKTEKVLLKKTFHHLINLPYSFFETRTYGDLIMRLGSINYVKDFILDKLIAAFFDLGIGIILLIYLGTISYKLLLVAIGIVLINCLSIMLTSKSIEYLNKEEILNASKVNGIQVETIYSIFTTKILRLENLVFKKWDTCFSEYLIKRKQREYYQLISTSVALILNIVSPLIILFIGYLGFKNHVITLGEIIISQSFIINLLSISSNIIQTYNVYLIASNYLDRVIDITNKQLEDTLGEVIEKIENIKINNVDFSYSKNGTKILKNISMDIKNGEKIAIVGETGCGKSTLGKLLMGLYEPSKGNIMYNSIDLKNLDKKKVLDLISIVPQDIYIYARNIFENIKLDRTNISEEDVYEAAKIACIHDEIVNFPLGYNTFLSDMGMNLSGGQRQRLAIARSILSNPNLILFDEGTSFLDNLTEKKIMNKLKSKHCTMVIIAHRLETIIDCDKIFLMKNGEIIESGSHEDLMNFKGEYFNLYNTNIIEDKCRCM